MLCVLLSWGNRCTLKLDGVANFKDQEVLDNFILAAFYQATALALGFVLLS